MGRIKMKAYGNQMGNGLYFSGTNPNQEGGIMRQVGGVIGEGEGGWWDHTEYDPEADNAIQLPDWRPYPPPPPSRPSWQERERLEREEKLKAWKERNSLKGRLKHTKEGLLQFGKDLGQIKSLKDRIKFTGQSLKNIGQRIKTNAIKDISDLKNRLQSGGGRRRRRRRQTGGTAWTWDRGPMGYRSHGIGSLQFGGVQTRGASRAAMNRRVMAKNAANAAANAIIAEPEDEGFDDDASNVAVANQVVTNAPTAARARGNWAFLKRAPKRTRDKNVRTDLDHFLDITGLRRRGTKKTNWHNAISPFQLHGAYAGRMKNSNRARMMAYALWKAYLQIKRGQRDPEYKHILNGYGPEQVMRTVQPMKRKRVPTRVRIVRVPRRQARRPRARAAPAIVEVAPAAAVWNDEN